MTGGVFYARSSAMPMSSTIAILERVSIFAGRIATLRNNGVAKIGFCMI